VSAGSPQSAGLSLTVGRDRHRGPGRASVRVLLISMGACRLWANTTGQRTTAALPPPGHRAAPRGVDDAPGRRPRGRPGPAARISRGPVHAPRIVRAEAVLLCTPEHASGPPGIFKTCLTGPSETVCPTSSHSPGSPSRPTAEGRRRGCPCGPSLATSGRRCSKPAPMFRMLGARSVFTGSLWTPRWPRMVGDLLRGVDAQVEVPDE